ncbi:hypothetical protein EV361DRAFT_881145 [Lentinula raphanica]|nr:hypothetical protein EV361DRAFT_881145 [Lentinula raphanica]
MSRRLTISSLLCDDNEDNSEPRIIPEPVVLAPHLRRSPQRVESDSTRNSSQPTPSSSSKIGLDALVHAASAVAAAEERSRLPAPSSSSSSSTWSSEGHYPQSPTYTYSPEQLQRHQQQLEQRHVHREQILGYKDHHRTGRKSDPLPGPGMRAILSPTSETAYSSPSTLSSSTTRFPHDADEHLDKKRRYSQEEYTLNIQREHQAREFERLRQQEDADRYRRMEEEQREMQHRRLQQETSDDIRNKITANNPPSRSSIAALTSPTAVSPSLPSRRVGAGYDPVHENDHHPAYNPSHSSSHWDRIQSPSQQFPSSSTHYAQRNGRPMEVIELNEQESEDDRAKRAWNGHREPPTHAPYNRVPQDSRTHVQTIPPAYRESHPATLSPTQERPQSRSDASVNIHHQYGFPREILSPASANAHHVQHIQREPRRESPLPPTFAAPPQAARESSSSASSHTHPQLPHVSYQPRDDSHQHRVISPIGRRSPPGSQTGRAIAAKKVEQEHQMPSLESVLRTSTPAAPLTFPVEETKPRRELTTAPVIAKDNEMHGVKGQGQEPEKGNEREGKRKEKKLLHTMVKSEESNTDPPPSASNRQQQQVDEWLLEQYADNRQKVKRPNSSDAVIRKPDLGIRHTTTTISPARKAPKPSTLPSTSGMGKRSDAQDEQYGDDAMMALQQELDAELAEVAVNSKPSPYNDDAMDVDVDQAVAELVDETLGENVVALPSGERQHLAEEGGESKPTVHGADGNKSEPPNELQQGTDDKEMDVDVEDELLSLLDDRPNSRMSASAQSGAPSTSSLAETKRPAKAKTPATIRMKNEDTDSRPASPVAGSPFRSSSVTGARQSSAKPSEQDDRESMPPPSTPIEKPETAVAAAQPKKKGKPGPKPKPRNPDGTIVGAPPPPPKPRGRPGPKPKPRDEFGNIIRTPSASSTPAPGATSTTTKGGRASSSTVHTPPQISRVASGSGTTAGSISGARSRSTSAHPAGSVGPEADPQAKEEDQGEEKEEEEDDKLYCLCKARYDEDKPMIACDSCDEWYHMKCVGIPEYMGDLVDQFYCPPCIDKNPSADLKTTYKTRCLYGINSMEIGTGKVCHKPARPFSKYCSDECGVKNLRKRIDNFTKKGGKKEDLWESVKTASKREGLVRVISPSPAMQMDSAGNDVVKPIIKEVKPTKTKEEREIERLNGLLADIEKIRDELHRGMDIILSREKLLQLAADRSENLGLCGWDQRLCFSDEDWTDFGEGVLESYAEQDGPSEDNAGEAEWWCPGDQECERHAGWQSLRAKDLDKEKEKKEEALFKLTEREREIRKRIDRIEEQDAGPLLGTAPRRAGGPPKSNKLSNGHATKAKVNGDTMKKGKKRKTLS